MIVVALVFLCMRAWVRVIQRKRPNLSDAFVLVSWMAYACNGIIFTLLTILQFDLSSSKQNTSNVDINATPDKLVQVLKVRSLISKYLGLIRSKFSYFMARMSSIRLFSGSQKLRSWRFIINFSHFIRRVYVWLFMCARPSTLLALLSQ